MVWVWVWVCLMTPSEAKLLLFQALAEPFGLLCKANDPERARQALYRARREALDPELDGLQVRLVAIGEGNLVICKSKVPAPAGTKALPGPTVEELDE